MLGPSKINHLLDIESTLTDRYQTTIPETVRRALKLNRRDRLSYRIQSDGSVLLARVEAIDESDPAMGAFLRFLANDIAAHPEAIRALDDSLQARLHALVGTIEVDLDSPLPDE